MKETYFSINEDGLSIRCKLYGTGAREYSRVVIFGHGFGGHKDNRAAEKFAAGTRTTVQRRNSPGSCFRR